MIALRLIAMPLAIIFPPLAVAITRGRTPALLINITISFFALAVFFFLFALPGLAIWGLGILHALIMALSSRRS